MLRLPIPIDGKDSDRSKAGPVLDRWALQGVSAQGGINTQSFAPACEAISATTDFDSPSKHMGAVDPGQ